MFKYASYKKLNAKRRRNSTPMGEVWKRLLRNHLAMIGLCTIVIIIFIAIFAPFISPYDYAKQDYNNVLQFPNRDNLLGTDNFGRDMLSRILYGTRYTLIIGFGCITSATIIGVFLGTIAALVPKIDNLIMRFTDIIMGIPTFMLALSVITALGCNIRNMMIAISITSIPSFVRITRAQVLMVKEQEFIEAARSIGASNFHIVIRHILPNSLAPIIVQYTIGMVLAILWGASLSFVGMGVQAPSPEWGLMISTGRAYLRDYWYMSIIPGIAIIITTYALNLLGDGLRDALDPRLKR